MSSVNDCKIIYLPRIASRQGCISPVTSCKDISFDIGRVYYLYDVPDGESRGGHAHMQLQQLLVAVMGSFDVVIDDGREKKRFTLNRGDQGLFIPKLIWRELENFSTGGICLVLASDIYDEKDYYRDYDAFLRAQNR